MTQGRWFFEKWGKAYSPAPTGAELYAWFSSPHNTTEKWRSFTNGLSGVICASLNFLDVSSSSHGTGPVSDSILFGDNFRYGTLSNEIVCTENLTPFKSLLPTRGKVLYPFILSLLIVDFFIEWTIYLVESFEIVF